MGLFDDPTRLPSCYAHSDRPATWRDMRTGVPMCAACALQAIKQEHEQVTEALSKLDEP